MGWIFGAVGAINPDDLSKFKALHGMQGQIIESEKLYLAIGGVDETCCFSSNIESFAPEGFVISGIGLAPNNHTRFKVMLSSDWDYFFRNQPFPEGLRDLNGHFAGVRFKDGLVELFCDTLGTREFYIAKSDRFIVFATRLDWAGAFAHDISFNLRALSTRWLLQNQISYESPVNNIMRLTAGGYCDIQDGKIVLKNAFYTPLKRGLDNIEGAEQLLSGFISSTEINGRELSLSISGGYDSRVLLALLIGDKNRSWDALSFGELEHPDNIISKKMTGYYGVNKTHYMPDFSAETLSIGKLCEFAAFTQLSAPISEFPVKNHYHKIYADNKIIIDGSWGEIARRALGKYLLIKGSKAISNKDFGHFRNLLKYNRADIFNVEAKRQLDAFSLEETSIMLDEMPTSDNIGLENWIDLYATRYRFPNYIGYEQSRIDSSAANISPFSQTLLHDYIFSIALKKKDNNRIFKDIINHYAPKLKRFPLVKGNVFIPYPMPPLASKILGRAKSTIGMGYKDHVMENFLKFYKNDLVDIINSTSFTNFELYDTNKIKNVAEDYYNGKNKEEWFLIWFLTFELFRRALKIE